MGIGTITQSELANFVKACDELGGVESSNCADLLSDFRYKPTSIINESLDPFSEEYVQQQITLYSEISGRTLNQQINEFTGFDLENCINAQNPYAHPDPTFIAKHSRTVLQAVELAQLPPNPEILDMGCGWGLSTEMMAFCGAEVTCVDINLQFLDLVKQRSQKRGHPVCTIHSDFESFESTKQFDMILFYECFHHAVRPWVVIDNLTGLLKPGGKIILAGEPIQSFWWKHWGVRLDSQSIYCMHKFGWFESGWSLSFLQQLFAKNNFHIDCRKKIGFDGGMICIVQNAEEYQAEKKSITISNIEKAHNYLRRWRHSPIFTTPPGRFLIKIYTLVKHMTLALERKLSILTNSK